MKKFVFLFVFLMAGNSAFGQQYLWSTKKDTTSRWERYVPLSTVTKEVLNYFDLYKYYYDFSGYSSERFIEEFDYGFDDWEWIKYIEELQVFSVKSNTGHGSLVIVVCISDKNADAVIFSNSPIQSTPLFTSLTNRKKFANWFESLLK